MCVAPLSVAWKRATWGHINPGHQNPVQLLSGVQTVLEPQCDDPAALWDHHKAQAELNRAAGDLPAAYWHGRKAQKARKAMLQQEHQHSLKRGRLAVNQTRLSLHELC